MTYQNAPHPGACRRCSSVRRWRLLHSDGAVGCWTCWRCVPPPPSGCIDILAVIGGKPSALFALPAASVTDALFKGELAQHGAPIAMALEPLPCRCRACSQRSNSYTGMRAA